MDVDIGETQLMVELAFKEQTLKERVLPSFEITQAKLELDINKLKFDLGGSVIAQMADVILPLLKSIIKKFVEKSVSSYFTKDLTKLINNYILE